MIISLVVSNALALNVTFELSHNVDLIDASAGTGDDFFTTNGEYLARWAYAELRLASNGAHVDSGYTDDDGKITFTGISLSTNYRIRLYAKHNVNGADLRFRVVDENDEVFWDKSAVWSISTVPAPGFVASIAYDAAATGNEWVNVAAVGSWLIRRRPDAWPTYTEIDDRYHQVALESSCVNDLPAAWYGFGLEVCIDLDHPDSLVHHKFVIAHEMGHGLSHWTSAVFNGYVADADDNENAMNVDYGADLDSDCPDGAEGTGHNWTTKEYQSAAIIEGIADYIAAVAFNNVNQDECRIWPLTGSVVWDPENGLGSNLAFSCEGWDADEEGENLGVDDGGWEWASSFDVDAGDFLGDYCTEGAVDNRGTELDWERFFWDLDTKAGVAFEAILTNFAAAGPADWNPDDAPTTDTGPDLPPREMLENAFDDDDDGAGPDDIFSDEWATWSGPEGVYR